MALCCVVCLLQIASFIAFIIEKSEEEEGVWYIESRQLPQPSATSQIAYNNLTSTVYLFGGYTSNGSVVVQSNNKIYKRNISNPSNPWIPLHIHTPTDSFFSQIKNTITINEIIYFIGINNGSYVSDGIYLFNLTAERFIPHNISLYQYPACSGCLVTNNSHIFMFGGINSPVYVNYIQILDIKSNIWTYETMNLSFISTGWAVQGCNIVNNTVYLFGGDLQYIPGKATNIMYKYDILSRKWYFLGNLSHWTAQAWTVYSNKYNKIYVVTLEDSSGNVTLSVFDIKQEKIVFKSKLILPTFQTPMLLNHDHDTITIYGGWPYTYSWVHYNLTYETTPSIFIQSVKLPLIPHKKPASETCDNMDTGLFVGLIISAVVVGILIGCIITFIWCKYRMNRDEMLLNTPRHIM